MKVLIDKLGNVLFKFEPADVTNFKHKCSLLLPGVAHRGTGTPSLGNLALATQKSRNTGNTGFAMTQLQNLPCDMMTPYLIIVADAADAVSVNFSGRCKFLQI